jgi:hypothetical protein
LLALALVLGLGSGCSRPSGGTEGSAAAQDAGSARPTPPTPASGPAPEAASARPGSLSVPTPEDAEEDAAHRITDQNLESELDRL